MAENETVALITGANKGIGLETARQLGHQGITVLVGARDAQKGEAAASELRAEGINAKAVTIDVTSTDSIADAARVIAQDYGKLDILVNNAGKGTFQTAASEESLVDWRDVYETNVFGLVAVTQAFLPLLRESEAGRIVNVSSILGSVGSISDPTSPVGQAGGYGAAYGSSKSAVNMFTVHLAKELADTPIKVNTIHPGWVKTDLGGENAPMNTVDGAKTSVALATIPADGPTGGYFHLGQPLPW